MRVHVKTRINHREQARIQIQMRRQRWTRKIIQSFVFLQHILAMAYAAFLGIYHLTASTPTTRMLLTSPYYGVVYIAMAILHLWACINYLWRVNVLAIPVAQRMYQKWMKSRDFQPCCHALEMASEVYLAYSMAENIVQPLRPLIYTWLLTFHMIWTSHNSIPTAGPIKRITLKATLNLLGQAILSFCISSGYIFCAYIVPIAGNASNLRVQRRNFEWAAQYLTMSRFLATSSILELFATVIPMLATFNRLQNVLNAVKTIPSRLKRTQTLNSINEEGPKEMRILPKEISLRAPSLRVLVWEKNTANVSKVNTYHRVHKSMAMGYIIFGLVMGIFASHRTIYRANCPRGCRYALSSWYSSTCTCSSFRWNCILDGPMDDFDTYLTNSFGSELLLLHIQYCPLYNGLAATTMHAFPNLYGLFFEVTNLTQWNIPSLSNSIMAVFIHSSNLTSIPPPLQAPPSNMQSLYITNTALVSVSETVWSNWSSLYELSLEATNLTLIPSTIQSLASIEYLDLGMNKLKQLPVQMAELKQLTKLFLDNNELVQFPSAIVAANPSMELILNSNPFLREIPSTNLQALQLLLIQVAATAYCNNTHSAVCYRECAPGCTKPRVGDNYCDLPCNVSTCNYDNGDCLFVY